MKILITGASGGIGAAVAERFLRDGHTVAGIDLLPAVVRHPDYTHYIADVRRGEELPVIPGVEILFVNAGVQNSEDDIDVNLKGAIRTAEFYVKGNGALRSVLFNASASAVSGKEFPVYAASKAGLLGYMKNLAVRLAPRGIPCNAISLGGVRSPLNEQVMNDPETWRRIMEVTPMKKWTEPEEVADWVEFLTVRNRSMSGENLLIDNGEYRLRDTFVWPGDADVVRLR
jgi:3-oxoacyl-[acyl-carrier protein] reductase